MNQDRRVSVLPDNFPRHGLYGFDRSKPVELLSIAPAAVGKSLPRLAAKGRAKRIRKGFHATLPVDFASQEMPPSDGFIDDLMRSLAVPFSSQGLPATRRGFLKTMAAATCGLALGAECLLAAGTPAKTSVKKGACGGIRGIPGLTKLNAKWFYNWGANPPLPPPPTGIEWVPIIFPHGVDKIASDCERVKAANCRVLLGYNEPDHKGQGNISVEVALRNWPTLMATGLKLVSPAVTWAPNSWMKGFMKQAKEKTLRIDAVAIHWYGAPNAKGFLDYVNNAHQLYGKPIWITEFAMQDKQASKDRPCRYTQGDALHFMREVLPELEKLASVERYCWYSAHKLADVRTGPSCLLDDASELTALGEYFKSV